MGMFDKSDTKFLTHMSSRHLRMVQLDRLCRLRKIWFFVVVVQSLAAVGILFGDSQKDASFLVIWAMFLIVFTLTDLQIKAIKLINETETNRTEQHGGRISSEGALSAPPNESSP